MAKRSFDFVIIGAGIVGLTVASELVKRHPKARLAILEKESAPGMHASGRNSGVLHSGIYYGRDTLKAKVCVEGARRMAAFAEAEGISVNRCGKVILATAEIELPVIDKLLGNARDNNIPAERIDTRQLIEIEPYAAPGPAAIYCPSTAVIDIAGVIRRLKEKLIIQGARFLFECSFQDVKVKGSIQTTQGDLAYGYLINCAGAYADRVAKAYGLAEEYALVPFKGIYWRLSEGAKHKVRANIYPVPDISMPFLGVHLTRSISGDVYVGPTAIPALGRENYGVLQGIDFTESAEIVRQLSVMYLYNENNFRKLTHLEVGKYWKKNFFRAVRTLLPSLDNNELVPTTKTGIRPQLVNTRTHKLEMDYILIQTDDSLHVLNAISPAFTGSFAFSELIMEKIDGA